MSQELDSLDALQAKVDDPQFAVGEYDIEVIDERPVEDQRELADPAELDDDAEPTEEELRDVSGRVKKRIDKLTFKYNDQRRAAEAATKMQEEAILYARKVQEENARMRKIMQEGEGVLISEVKERAKLDVERAQNIYARALEEGDVAEVAKAQAELNRAQIEQYQADQHRPGQYVDPNVTQEPYQPQAAPQAQQEDPLLTAWKDKNEWFETDPRLQAYAKAIHADLEANQNTTGIIVGSEAYYDKIDSTMRENFPSLFRAKGNSDMPAASPAPPVVAPASRNTVPSGQPRKVQLTETQVALANRLNIPLEVYAREELKLNNKGGQ